MRTKALPHIILAVILALTAGVLTIRWLGSQRSAEVQKPKAEVKKINVVVAARPIPKGAKLDAGMLRLKAYETDVAPLGAARVLDEVEGRITARDVSQDDPITQDKLLPRGVTVAGLANSVEPGKRAVTVKGSKVLGSGGLITPGSRVDVVATFQVPGKADAKVGKVILQDIPVLTTGTEMETHLGKDGKEELSNTELYTLMVTPAQAEQLALAADQGQLHFALRRTGDERPVATQGSDLGDMAGAAEASPAKSATGSPAVPQYTYQAVRASAPKALGEGGSSGGGGGAGAAGAAPAGGAPQPSVASSPFGAQAGTKTAVVPGATDEGQGSDQIKVHHVVIECDTCPLRQ
jgi:pilus assembly protein CpaB